MQGVILAAGKGSRLNPITTNRSKAMLPILGEPIVARVFDNLWRSRISNFVIVVSDNDLEIIHYFKNNSPNGVDIKFVTQKERLGMAHALACASHLINTTFVLSACDNLVSEDHVRRLINKHKSNVAEATLSLMKVDKSRIPRTGIVAFEENKVDIRSGDVLHINRIVEKPNPKDAPSSIASLPLYVLPFEIISFLPKVGLSPRGEYEIQDALQMIIDKYGTVQGVVTDSRLTLTSPKDLLDINRQYLIDSLENVQLDSIKVGKNTQMITPLRIEEGTKIGSDCSIGPNVYIENNSFIGDGVILKDSVVLRESVLKSGSRFINTVVY